MQVAAQRGKAIGSRLMDYRLVARPDKDLVQKISTEVGSFFPCMDQASLQQPIPSIEIARFQLREEMEETLLRWLSRIVNAQQAFKVTVNNYGAMPPDNIHLRILDLLPFIQLGKDLSPVLQFIESGEVGHMQLHQKPHLSFGVKLPEDNFTQLVTDFAAKTFNGSFQLQQLILLRKEKNGSCREVSIFGMQPPATQSPS